MSKNTIIVLGVVTAIIIGGAIVFIFLQKGKVVPVEEPVSEESFVEEAAGPEVFSLSAIVLSVNSADNFLMVKPENEEKEIKVILNEETEITKLGVPSEVKESPKKGGVFIPTKKDIGISDILEGDKIFITTNTNIAGKTEFDDVKVIQVFP